MLTSGPAFYTPTFDSRGKLLRAKGVVPEASSATATPRGRLPLRRTKAPRPATVALPLADRRMRETSRKAPLPPLPKVNIKMTASLPCQSSHIDDSALLAPSWNDMLLRSRRAHHVAPLPLVDAPSRRLSESGSTTADFEADVAKRAAEFLAAALRGEARIIGSASPQLGDAPAAADVPSPKGHRPKRHASGKVDYTSDTPPSEASQTLRAQWKQIWSKNSSPSWGARSCDAWGGVGYTIELDDGDGGRMHVGWDHHVESVAERFDEQDRRFSNQADLLRARPLSLSSAALSHDAGGGRRMMSTELHNCLDGLASNRFNVQALRLTTNNVAPSDRRGAKEFMKPLALAAGVWGGPLVPVYERHFATENVEEEEEEEE